MEQRPLANVEQAESDLQRPRPASPTRGNQSEDVQRVNVEPEDRLAFRVGVNILTLALLVLAGYLVWRNFIQ